MSTVSIIVPCYNAQKFIAQTIESVLKQTYANFQLILVNDGSTDGTEQIIKQYQDDRIIYVSKDNTGVADTRNKGIEMATGEYIAFLDADDLYLPDNLLEKITFLEKNPHVPLVHGQEIKFQSATSQIIAVTEGCGGDVLRDLLSLSRTVIHSPSSVVMTRALVQQVGGFDPQLSTSADWEYWVRIAAKYPIGFISKPLIKYRVHNNQMHSNIGLMEKDMQYAFAKIHAMGGFGSQTYYRFCYAKLSLILSACFWGHTRNYYKFLRYFITSIVYNPVHLWKKLSPG